MTTTTNGEISGSFTFPLGASLLSLSGPEEEILPLTGRPNVHIARLGIFKYDKSEKEIKQRMARAREIKSLAGCQCMDASETSDKLLSSTAANAEMLLIAY